MIAKAAYIYSQKQKKFKQFTAEISLSNNQQHNQT